MKSYKKIVLFDMDDTLSDFKTGIIPASAYRAIDLLHERKDILIGMASGRGHFFFAIKDRISKRMPLCV